MRKRNPEGWGRLVPAGPLFAALLLVWWCKDRKPGRVAERRRKEKEA
jgi:hypothetical protein